MDSLVEFHRAMVQVLLDLLPQRCNFDAKKTATRRTDRCLYIFVPNYTAVVGLIW
jgi:hypothetical protein